MERKLKKSVIVEVFSTDIIDCYVINYFFIKGFYWLKPCTNSKSVLNSCFEFLNSHSSLALKFTSVNFRASTCVFMSVIVINQFGLTINQFIFILHTWNVFVFNDMEISSFEPHCEQNAKVLWSIYCSNNQSNLVLRLSPYFKHCIWKNSHG